MKRLLAAVGVALVLCAPAGASHRGSEQDIAYSPATLPAAKVGTKYDVTMTAKYPAINGGGYASLGTQMTLTTSSQAAPGILFRVGKVPGGSSLILIGNPTAPGTFHFATCVVFSDGSCDLKQWTLVVNGKVKKPSWVAEAQDMRDDVEDSLTEEFHAVAMLQAEKYTKAKGDILGASVELSTSLDAGGSLPDIVPPGSAASAEAKTAVDEVNAAKKLDLSALSKTKTADDETGDKEIAAKHEAINLLDQATAAKYKAADALAAMIASPN